ncbi:MAG TPA: PTS sugar transporter subunit IIA [Candidatus Anammoximicrobium sp.]|nr:PTS sugar transporter subunit IIA [Candidatus Anammoximicrobium sp.]
MTSSKTGVVKSSIALARIFPPEAVVIGLDKTSKQAVIAALVRRLITLGQLPEQEEDRLVEEIMKRESLGTTALGNGVAFPHTRTPLANRLLGVLGLERTGISFDSLDRSPVYAVFLLLAPDNATKEYFEVLGRITAIGKDKSLRLQLRGCRTAEAVHRFLQILDAE